MRFDRNAEETGRHVAVSGRSLLVHLADRSARAMIGNILGSLLALFAVTLAVAAKAETPAERTVRFLSEFAPGDEVTLKPIVGHPDRALAERLVLADPHIREAWRRPKHDPHRIGPEHIVAGRARLAPNETERLFILVKATYGCSHYACSVDVYVRRKGKWKLDFELSGHRATDGGFAPILTQPIVGRFFDLKSEKYAEPTIIEPNNNGRPVFIWRYEGVVWDGRDWAPFCWQACGDGGA
jgi:hypothetical protein